MKTLLALMLLAVSSDAPANDYVAQNVGAWKVALGANPLNDEPRAVMLVLGSLHTQLSMECDGKQWSFFIKGPPAAARTVKIRLRFGKEKAADHRWKVLSDDQRVYTLANPAAFGFQLVKHEQERLAVQIGPRYETFDIAGAGDALAISLRHCGLVKQ